MLTKYFDSYAWKYQAYKKGAWCYEDGCLYRGLEMLHGATGEDRWLNHIIRLVEAQLGEGSKILSYNPAEYNIDHVQAGRALLYLDKATNDPRYMQATSELKRQLATHPRTKSGVYWHKLIYPWQIWLDGLYMVGPFQLGLSLATGDDAGVEDILTQFQTALDMTYDSGTGLYAHAYDEARMQRWSDPETGHSPAFWARALGWLAMAFVDNAELVGPERFEPFRRQAVEFFEKIQSLRVPDGLWLQVIDRPDLEDNYQEASASAMFVYALLCAERLGWLPPSKTPLFETLVQKTVRLRDDGVTEMYGMCGVAGLGGFQGRYRDGTPEYYLSEEVVADDPKGVAPLMSAYALDLMRQHETQKRLAGE